MKLTTPDEGWSWMVMLASSGINVAVGCLVFSIGIVQLSIMERFSDTKMKTSLPGSLFLFFISCGGIVTSVLIARLGCRITAVLGSIIATTGYVLSVFVPSLDWLVVTYGLIAGFGMSLAYTTAIVVVNFNFQRHRNVATGFAVAGNGVGTIIFPVILEVVVKTYGHIAIFFIMAAISIQILVFGCMLFPSYLERQNNYKQTRPTATEHRGFLMQKCIQFIDVCKYCRFMMVCICLFFGCVGNSISFVYLPSYCVSNGYTSLQASLLITVAGICSLVFRFMTGLATNSGDIDERLVYIGSYGILGLATVLFPLYGETYTGEIIFSVMFGVYFANIYVLLNSINTRLVGLELMALAYGIEMIFVGSGELLGPPLAGFILDNGGSFDDCFITAGAFLLAGSLIGLFSELLPHKNMSNLLEMNSKDIELTVDEESEKHKMINRDV